MNRLQKVYVLDYDLISPLGIGMTEVFSNLQSNKIAAERITQFDPSNLSLDYAAEIPRPLDYLVNLETSSPVLEAAAFDRKLYLTVAIYSMMKRKLEELISLTSSSQAGIIFGMGADAPPFEKLVSLVGSDFEDTEESLAYFLKKINPRRNSLVNNLLNPYDVSTIYLAERLKLGAFQKTVLTACAASTQAIALGYSSIARREAEVIIAGGSDSIINHLAFITFSKLGVLAQQAEAKNSCRPFDINRNGTLAGEASGLCILAGEDFVVKNKLTPSFEILGYGNTLDAYHITTADPKGNGMKRAFRQALETSGLKPSEVAYINLHGTGTRTNDPVELDAVLAAFGNDAAFIPMSSTKDRHGHAIAAAGIQEFAILCESMRHDFIPCNANLERPITDSSIADLVMKENRNKKIKNAMTSNFAFGGVNTVLTLQKI